MIPKKRIAVRISIAGFLAIAALCIWMLAVGASGTKWTDYAITLWYDDFQNNDTYTIEDPAQLAGVAKLVNEGSVGGFNGKTIKIAADIDLSAHEWVPIGTEEHPFRGMLYAPAGEEQTISGLRIVGDVTYAGLVGNAANATIGGFTIADTNSNINLGTVTGSVYSGTAVGKISGSGILYDINSNVPMTIDGGSQTVYAGGIAGYAEGTVSNSNYAGSIEAAGAHAAIGGIIGYGGPQGLEVKRVANTAQLAAGGSDVAVAGGIVGQSVGALRMQEDGTPILNSGSVSILSGNRSYAGGIVGRADQAVTFSMATTNQGAVTINAPNGSMSAAGGLIGAITAEMGNYPINIDFASSGNVVNNGGAEVYTGGIAGLLNTTLVWQRDITSNVSVSASGAEDVHTGGLIGRAEQQIQWNAAARNVGPVTVGPSIGGALNNAFTGGLIGSSSDRILLESAVAAAYGNSGVITVNGNRGLYTGGIAANRTFARSGGTASNVVSTGAVTVSGDSLLHTGGYVGTLPAEAIDHDLSGLSFDGSIDVTATDSAANEAIATGGIVGYYGKAAGKSAELAGLSFSGHLNAQGGEFTYTGGIAGYVDNGIVRDAEAGANASAHATIQSDGKLGGIAGYLKGDLDGAEVAYITLTARAADSYAGGVAALAQGAITNARVGDSAGNDHRTVLLGADLTGNGDDNFTAGGIVGINDGLLELTSSGVVKTGLISAIDRSGYTLGGIAGVLTGDAVVGQAGEPITAAQLTVDVNAENSLFGGAVGLNRATELYLATTDVTIRVEGDNVRAGGVIGLNEAAAGLETTKLDSLRAVLSAFGAGAKLGGIAGQNTGRLIHAEASEGRVELEGSFNQGGGVVGSNRGEIVESGSVNAALHANAAGAALGGIAGISEPSAPDGVAPVIADSFVHALEAILGTATANNVRMGGLVGFASQTTISNPLVKADNSDYVIMMLSASGIRAGGIAGETSGGSISGSENTVDTNLQQLFVSSTDAAANSYVGGIVGYGDKTAITEMTARGVSFNLGGAGSIAGGIAGYFQGTDSSVISDSYMDTLGMRALATAIGSVVGGAVGLNDSRLSDEGADPATASSTLQNTRIIGNVANSNSPVIDNLAANAIIGGLVGENRSLVANNSVIDKLLLLSRGNDSIIGGHTGVNRESGKLYYTYANVNLSIHGEGVATGGLAGLNEGDVLSSYVDIDVSGQAVGTVAKSAALGGLVGINKGLIDKSYSVSNVASTGAHMVAGGLVGEQLDGLIRNSYAGNKVAASGTGSYAGGFAGRIEAGEIRESYSAANVTATGDAQGGGFAGLYDNASTELLYKVYYVKDDAALINKDLPDFAEGHFRWLNVPARLSTLLEETLGNREAFPGLSGWDFAAVWRYGSPQAQYRYPELIRTANTGGGGGTPGVNASINWYTRNPDAITFEIRSEAELAGLASLVNGTVLGVAREDFAGRTVRIVNPIHIQSDDWIAIGADEATPFEGAFNGGGHLIDGLSIAPGQGLSGLFGAIGVQGSIDNVRLEPVAVSGNGVVGALVAINRGTLTQITVELPADASVKGQTVGGVIGRNAGTIANVSLLFREGAVVEAVGLQPVGGALIGDNSAELSAGSFGELNLQGTVRSVAADAVIGGYVGVQSNDMNDLVIVMNYTVSAEGAGGIAGGVVGRYTAGEMADLSVQIRNGTVSASAPDATAGGVAGVSESGNTLRRIELTAAETAAPFSGGGTLGGVIGSKTGRGEDRYDIDGITATGLRLTTPADADHTTIGGLFGRLANTVAGQLHYEGELSPRSLQTTLGGVVGETQDSLLRGVEAVPQIAYEAVGGASVIGGIAGALHAASLDDFFDLGAGIPYYAGLYDARAHDASIAVSGTGNAAEVTLGGLVGKLEASLYFSDARVALEASGVSVARMGGIAGLSRGIIVSSVSRGGLQAAQSTVYYIGGAVGQAEGGAIHYAYVAAEEGVELKVAKPLTKLPTLPVVYAGGFVGKGDNVKLTHASTGMPTNVISDNSEDAIYAGGFAGVLGDNGALPNGSIEWAYATGSVHVNARTVAFAGGFAASLNRYDVNNAYASGRVDNSGFDTRTGGFAGAVERRATITDAYAAQNTLQATGVNHATRAYLGGFTGYNDGILTRVYAHASDISLTAAGASAYKGALAAYQYRDGRITDSYYAGGLDAVGHSSGAVSNLLQEDRLEIARLEDWQLRSDASFLLTEAGEAYVILTPIQLLSAVLLANDDSGLAFYRLFDRSAAAAPTANIELGANIDLTGMVWKPFIDFRQRFDGSGFAIKGLKAYADSGAQGFVTRNYGRISNLLLEGAAIAASSADSGFAGIVAGINEPGGEIVNVQASGTVSGGVAGGIAGSNAGTISDAQGNAAVQGAIRAGGIAGINTGAIHVSSTGGSVSGAIAGGIAGENGSDGIISGVFSYSDVSASDEASASAGGIAGLTAGAIEGSFFSGTAAAAGGDYARAGGIAGHATDGIISGVVNVAEAQAGTDGKIVRNRSMFGGIAGQKEDAAIIESALYNRQMIKTDTAYYNASGKRVAGGAEQGIRGLTGAQLSSGALPVELDAALWQSTAGYYPQLKAYGGSLRSRLSAAALVLAEQDTVYSAIQSFALSSASDIVWSAAGATLTPSGSGIGGQVTAQSGSVVVTATALAQPQRSIAIRKAPLPFGEIAAAPTFNEDEQIFEKSIVIELATEEAGGMIYYTLNGSEPVPGKTGTLLYSEPLNLQTTTTIRALVIAEDKEPSRTVSGVWTLKQVPIFGGGIFIPPAAVETEPQMSIGNREIPLDGNEPIKTAIGSRLTLTMPDDVIVYYTIDGSEPTKDSPRYAGDIWITGDMTIRFITSKNNTIYTIHYEVRPAEFEIRPNAAEIRYMSGRPGGMFHPDAAMTRDELIAAAANLLEFEPTPIGLTFADVPRSKSDIIAKFASAGIVQGYPDGTFKGDRGLTRAEFVVLMSRILGLSIEETEDEVPFGDTNSHWARSYVQAFVRTGYVNGYPDGTFRPDKLILRSEAVVLMNRIMLTANKVDPSISFSDVPPDHWAYESIMAASK